MSEAQGQPTSALFVGKIVKCAARQEKVDGTVGVWLYLGKCIEWGEDIVLLRSDNNEAVLFKKKDLISAQVVRSQP